jgi:hypothetical protein
VPKAHWINTFRAVTDTGEISGTACSATANSVTRPPIKKTSDPTNSRRNSRDPRSGRTSGSAGRRAAR